MSASPVLRSLRIRHEHDVVGARRRAREVAALLGFEPSEQTRIATAVSELARNAYQYAGGGTVDYFVEGSLAPQLLTIRISDTGHGIKDLEAVISGRYRSQTGMGLGIVGTRKLMDVFEAKSDLSGTVITIKKIFPRRAPFLTAAVLAQLSSRLAAQPPSGPFEEVQQQNQELLRTLDELRAKKEDLERVNRELEDTNRGVVALYAELDERADHLRRADELKTRFLSNMTHEFRTPVNSILALTNLLADRVASAPDTKDELFYIRKSAQQLSDLVDDLLDLAKVEAGKIEVRAAPFEVEGLFGALRGMLRPLLVNQSLALIFEEPVDIPPIFSDESKVSQILRNFISNALKYTERGEVRVSARLTSLRNAVEFVVADTGIGIPQDSIERVFDEFVQIENPLQRRVKGTGLGLPLSKRLTELLGGSIAVKSELGVGSTFSVVIPIVFRGIAPTIAPIQPGRVGILVVEDSDEDLLLYERALASTRFQVIPASTVAAAVSIFGMIRPAAIVLDVRLQGDDSWDFLTKLKRDATTSAIPVILATTYDDRQKAQALGADAFALKPIEKNWLIRTLDKLLPSTAPLRVLSVDDEEAFQYIVREMLNDPRYEVRQAASGGEGLRLIHEVRPDILLLDWRLHDMNGNQLLDRLRRDSRTVDVPVVLVTAQRLSPDDLRDAGDPPLLPKSALTRENLRAMIHQVVAARQPESRT
jgi:signal transduction histidine kinase/CheY-like chemotaxis protein